MADILEVGQVGDEHFIAVSLDRSEPATKPLTGDRIMTVRIRREDIPWLIEGLQRELDGDASE